MSNTAILIWKGVGVSIVFALLVTAVAWGYRMKPTDVPCRSLSYDIADREQRLYLTEIELTQLLKAEGLYPVGKTLDKGSLHRIERTISNHPMVRTAQCYVTPRHEVHIRLTQRVPLLRVERADGAFFIDTDRRVMPIRPSVRDRVLLATGAVGVQTATTQLADFAEWVQQNPYWQQRIDHVFIQSPQMVIVCLRNNQPRVKMGAMRGFEQKLAKLRVFLENGAEATKDKQYTELDVRFRGQVIGKYN